MRIKTLAALLVLGISVSCVPLRKYQDLEANNLQYVEQNKKLKAENESLLTTTNEQGAELEKLRKQVEGLVSDTTTLGSLYRRTAINYNQLNSTYEQLLRKNQELLAGNRTETQKILIELQESQEKLLRKEDELNKLEKELNAQKASLDELSQQLGLAQEKMMEKEARINEMQKILERQDSVVKALRNKVADALRAYENNGLTIINKNGKIYVSLDEKLLFSSGSWQVDPKGVDALKKLAKVLETNPEINIMVEGHTDNVPYRGSGQVKDNWDLSVMRATAIVNVLISNSKINPSRIIAAGRSEYIPVDTENTAPARAKNRRTEIILTPKLDELFQIIESN
jgi:chemotaxis protein MotB